MQNLFHTAPGQRVIPPEFGYQVEEDYVFDTTYPRMQPQRLLESREKQGFLLTAGYASPTRSSSSSCPPSILAHLSV